MSPIILPGLVIAAVVVILLLLKSLLAKRASDGSPRHVQRLGDLSPTSDGPKSTEPEAGEDKSSLHALVWLLREPRFLDSRVLTTIVSSAIGRKLDPDDSEATEFAVGELPTFVVVLENRHFLVHSFPTPYVDDPEAVAEDILDLRLRQKVASHRAWLSVDLLQADEMSEDELAAAYRVAAKIFAELADEEDCLAMYLPASGRMLPMDSELLEGLRRGDEEIIGGRMAYVPVVPVSDDDPRMAAAVAEARGAFPQFVAAFENRADDQNFSVKGPITRGERTEFIWINVDAIEGDVIYGKLGNDPIDLPGLKLGDRVRLGADELSDWIYFENEDMHGGFSLKVIKQIQEEHAKKRK